MSRGVANRHRTVDGSTDYWFDKLGSWPGTETPNGPVVAGYTIMSRWDDSPIHVDVIGVGNAVYDTLTAPDEACVMTFLKLAAGDLAARPRTEQADHEPRTDCRAPPRRAAPSSAPESRVTLTRSCRSSRDSCDCRRLAVRPKPHTQGKPGRRYRRFPGFDSSRRLLPR